MAYYCRYGVTLSIFTRLRIALDQAGAIQQLTEQVTELTTVVRQVQFEWGDTLDKLLAREERWRKRYKSEVDRALNDPGATTGQNASTPVGGSDKGALRTRLTALRAQG